MFSFFRLSISNIYFLYNSDTHFTLRPINRGISCEIHQHRSRFFSRLEIIIIAEEAADSWTRSGDAKNTDTFSTRSGVWVQINQCPPAPLQIGSHGFAPPLEPPDQRRDGAVRENITYFVSHLQGWSIFFGFGLFWLDEN